MIYSIIAMETITWTNNLLLIQYVAIYMVEDVQI